MKNNHKKLEIKNIERWRIKFTDTRKHYFQFHSSWWSDSDFLALSNDSKALFLWMLSQSLTQNKHLLSICLESACIVLRCSLDDVKGMLSELDSKDIIHLQTKTRKKTNSQLIEENRIEENRIEQHSKNDLETKVSNVPDFYDDVVEKWNYGASKYNLPKVKTLSTVRRKKLKVACKIYKDIEDWRKIFSVAVNKGFTREGSEPFIPNWDYVFRNENYVKFYEEYEIMFEKQNSSKSSISEADAFIKGIVGL